MIRFIIGLLLIFGGVGGMENPVDNSTDEFLMQLGIIAVGLLLMFWGSRNLKGALFIPIKNHQKRNPRPNSES